MAQGQLPGMGTRTGITPVEIRLTMVDVGTQLDPLRISHRLQLRHRGGTPLTVAEAEWHGRMLDLIPSGWSDMAAAFLWGEGQDVTKAHRDLHHAARRHRLIG